MRGGFADDAHIGADPKSSGVAPQPPLAYAALGTGGSLAGMLADAMLAFRCPEVPV
jgi:hypothetical protein